MTYLHTDVLGEGQQQCDGKPKCRWNHAGVSRAAHPSDGASYSFKNWNEGDEKFYSPQKTQTSAWIYTE